MKDQIFTFTCISMLTSEEKLAFDMNLSNAIGKKAQKINYKVNISKFACELRQILEFGCTMLK